jgi:hypothetical protein
MIVNQLAQRPRERPVDEGDGANDFMTRLKMSTAQESIRRAIYRVRQKLLSPFYG